MAKGLDLLPGFIVDQHFSERKRQERLVGAIAKNPSLVGLGLDEGTAALVKGRSLRVLGAGSAHFLLAAGADRPASTLSLKAGKEADVVQLRRAARDRADPAFASRPIGIAEVPKGTLVIVGGGGMPAGLAQKFIDFAGGPEALIVVLPTANPDPLPPGAETGMFRRLGAKNVVALPARTKEQVEAPANLEVLSNAKAIWFGGGRQWRFMDAYEGTKAEALFRDVLARGGVIGGSSAGATIQGDYLCRGGPLGNLEVMVEGYERGLAFLPGVAIDQHFAQRNRFKDLTLLAKARPRFLGIGLDEATAVVVQGSTAEITGRGKAHFFDPGKKEAPGYVSLAAGAKYDLKARIPIPAASK